MSQIKQSLGNFTEHWEMRIDRIGHRLLTRRGRFAEVMADDTFLVSYPRSGNTWLSFILTNALHLDTPTTFNNLDQRCPDIYVNTGRFLRSRTAPRLLKSHEQYRGDYPRVIYLVRDPRDVALSYWRFLRKVETISDELPEAQYVEGFLRGLWETEYGNWAAHVGGWLKGLTNASHGTVIRYEDLLADPHGQTRRLFNFMAIDPDDDVITRAIELSSASNMRRYEHAETATNAQLSGTRRDLPFVAVEPTLRGALSTVASGAIVRRWRPVMQELGYL